jgi:hypothetical protein
MATNEYILKKGFPLSIRSSALASSISPTKGPSGQKHLTPFFNHTVITGGPPLPASPAKSGAQSGYDNFESLYDKQKRIVDLTQKTSIRPPNRVSLTLANAQALYNNDSATTYQLGEWPSEKKDSVLLPGEYEQSSSSKKQGESPNRRERSLILA